jgi:hypothetical protein
LSFEINTRIQVFEKFQNQRATGYGYLKKIRIKEPLDPENTW